MDISFLTLVKGQLEKPSPLETQQLSPVHMGWEINYSWGVFLQREAVSDPPITPVLQRAASVGMCCAGSSHHGSGSRACPGMLAHSHHLIQFNSIQFND